MKTFLITAALWLFIGSQSGTALPTAGRGSGQASSQISQLLQSSGLQGLSTTELTTLLRGINSQGANCGNGAAGGAGGNAGEGEAAGEGQGEAAAGEGEGEANEVNLNGQFDTAVAVEGGDIKQDILFTKSTVGSFEYEFQNDAADQVTVTENKTPAPPPTGFEALEPNSFKVSLAQSKGAGLTLSKIDFIFDTTSAGLQGKDITQSKVGRFCPDTGAFMISETLGELEFEAEENEVTLNLNKNVTAEAEWGIFLPVAGAAAAGGAARLR